MKNLLKIKTTKRVPDEIFVDISDEACLPFGFYHKEVVICPNGTQEAIIMGVAPGNDGVDVLWYEIIHWRTKGEACYYETPGNLLKAGFKKKTA
ncbi:MAG: hypothetical protein AAB493_02405 [Patescibacteria group bacterium]